MVAMMVSSGDTSMPFSFDVSINNPPRHFSSRWESRGEIAPPVPIREENKTCCAGKETPTQHDKIATQSVTHPSCQKVWQKGIITTWYGFPLCGCRVHPRRARGAATPLACRTILFSSPTFYPMFCLMASLILSPTSSTMRSAPGQPGRAAFCCS